MGVGELQIVRLEVGSKLFFAASRRAISLIS
jgi:hypothetical protein